MGINCSAIGAESISVGQKNARGENPSGHLSALPGKAKVFSAINTPVSSATVMAMLGCLNRRKLR